MKLLKIVLSVIIWLRKWGDIKENNGRRLFVIYRYSVYERNFFEEVIYIYLREELVMGRRLDSVLIMGSRCVFRLKRVGIRKIFMEELIF